MQVHQVADEPSGDTPVAPDGGSDTGAGGSGDGTGTGTGGGPGLGTEDGFAQNPSNSGESVTTATRRELGALAGTLPFTGLILWAIALAAMVAIVSGTAGRRLSATS